MPTNIKQPTTIEQQIEQLKSRGMLIHDELDIHQWLSTVGYYRLSGYWWMYEERYPSCSPRNHKFKEGTSWDQVKHLSLIHINIVLIIPTIAFIVV